MVLINRKMTQKQKNYKKHKILFDKYYTKYVYTAQQLDNKKREEI